MPSPTFNLACLLILQADNIILERNQPDKPHGIAINTVSNHFNAV